MFLCPCLPCFPTSPWPVHVSGPHGNDSTMSDPVRGETVFRPKSGAVKSLVRPVKSVIFGLDSVGPGSCERALNGMFRVT